MARHTQYFTVLREVDGEEIEYELEVECDIEPFEAGFTSGSPDRCYPNEGGFAIIDGQIRDINAEAPWEGTLTKKEEEMVQRYAYESWMASMEPPEPDVDDEVGYYDYDDHYDSFHDDRAIALEGGGKVYL